MPVVRDRDWVDEVVGVGRGGTLRDAAGGPPPWRTRRHRPLREAEAERAIEEAEYERDYGEAPDDRDVW